MDMMNGRGYEEVQGSGDGSGKGNGTDSDSAYFENLSSQQETLPPPVPDGRLVGKTVSALAVACHNLAVETEFTQGGEKALGWYKRSAELVKVVNNVGDDGQGNQSMKEKILYSYFDAKRKFGLGSNASRYSQRPSSAIAAATSKAAANQHSGAPLKTIRSMKINGNGRGALTNDGVADQSPVSDLPPETPPDDTYPKTPLPTALSPNPAYASNQEDQAYDKVRANVMTKKLQIKNPAYGASDGYGGGVTMSSPVYANSGDDEMELDTAPGSAMSPPVASAQMSFHRPRSAGDARKIDSSKYRSERSEASRRPKTATVSGRFYAAPTTSAASMRIEDLLDDDQGKAQLTRKIRMMDELAAEARQVRRI